MDEAVQEKLCNTTMQTITAIAKLPVIKVDREVFLRKQFAKSPYLEQIVANGPPSVYKAESLRKKAEEIVKNCTAKTSMASFIAGIPANPAVMVAAGGIDIAQYFGFAVNMAQQIAYLFGEDNLFDGDADELSDSAKIRIVAYMGAMLGASGAAALIAKTSQRVGLQLGKQVANRALTKTVWYPLVKKVAAFIGQKITKKTVEKTITKAMPLVGGVVSGGLTYVTFRPMGNRLTDVFVRNLNGEFNAMDDEMELNPDFLKNVAVEAAEVVEVQ